MKNSITDKIIPFSPPDITELEINEVIDTLRSGWITTGPKTKLFENKISSYCGAEKSVCLSSATAGLELLLKMFEIGEGDEIITTPFTYAATANVILHSGAKPVFVDIQKDSFNIDYNYIEQKITNKTKAIITVDYGGFPCDYDEINRIIKNNKKFAPSKNIYQQKLNKILLIDDAAHSFGSFYNANRVGNGNDSDFTVFSFHAVKNLTTAEGGAITFNGLKDLSANEIYNHLMLLSLHGQNKDALSKSLAGKWRYDIELPGYKYNMTDIQASLGLAQLSRYDSEIIPKREQLFETYFKKLDNDKVTLPNFYSANKKNNYHLFPIRINGIDEDRRDTIIEKMAQKKISVNVHFIPLPLFTVYKRLGYDITCYPNAYNTYKNLITLPLYSKLEISDAEYVADTLMSLI